MWRKSSTARFLMPMLFQSSFTSNHVSAERGIECFLIIIELAVAELSFATSAYIIPTVSWAETCGICGEKAYFHQH